MIALLGAMLFANLDIVPLDSPSYDDVWGRVVPIAVPLLLFDANIMRIWRESGRTILIFHVASAGTIIGVCIATAVLHDYIPEIKGISAMFTGTYIGGSMNLAAMKDAFDVTSEMTSAAIVADNFLMAVYFFALMTISSMAFFRKRYPMRCETSPRIEENGDPPEGTNKTARFWDAKEISLLDIISSVAIAAAIVTAGTKLADAVNASLMPGGIKSFLGQKYLLITTLTVVCASAFPGFFGRIRGAKEIGTFFIHIFFVVIGVSASISMIFQKSPLLLVFAGIIIVTNMSVSLIFGKIFKFSLEEVMIACNATIGGPTTAAAMVIAKGWGDMVVPALLAGVWGYVIGSYAAIALVACLW
jgi:uncharacterized membrane protein